MSQYDQTGLTFKLLGTDTLREANHTQPVVDSFFDKALSPVFEDLLISLLKVLREEAFASFPGSDAARPSRQVWILVATATQASPVFRPPIKIGGELWETVCAPVLDALGTQQPPAFWFTIEGERNLEALLRKTLKDHSYVF